MAKNTTATGKLGEDLACGYLVKNGYKVIRRNYREKWGEIDIIGKSRSGTLVFFEVKALGSANPKAGGLMPEDHATVAKLKKLRRICQMFVAKHADLVDEKKGWRLDLIAIVLDSTNPAEDSTIRHYENI